MSLPGLALAGELLFFVSPKKPKEKKGDPQSECLRCSAQPGRGEDINSDSDFLLLRNPSWLGLKKVKETD